MTQDEFQIHVVETLTRLDTKMEDLVGNGKPGRVAKLEEKVESIDRWRWTMAGTITGVSSAIGAAIHFLFKH